MAVLFMNACPHPRGATATLLRAVASGAQEKHETEWVDVYSLQVAPCRGCLRCRSGGICVLPEDDAHRLAPRIHEAESLVIGTPAYWGNMTGPLKVLLDRSASAFWLPDDGAGPHPAHSGKTALIVTTSEARWPLNLLPTQGAGAARAVRTVLAAGGYRLVGIVNVPNMPPEAQVPVAHLRRAVALGQRL